MGVAILTLLGGLVVLVAGGEALVRGAVGIATRFGIPQLVIGLTVVSFGTSAPELLVSVQAALAGSPDLALGNVAGSNLVNISLVLGITIIIFPIVVAQQTPRVHWPVLLVASALLIWTLWDNTFTRIEGIVFLLILVAYVTALIRSSRIPANAVDSDKPSDIRGLLLSVLLLMVGITGLAFGADWTVDGATEIADGFGISERVVGLTVVAFGTSLPELVASVMAALRKQPDISVGNLVGSNIFNILLIVGATGVVTPIKLLFSEFSVDLWVMMAVTVLLLPLMMIGRRMGRWQGVTLLGCYTAYVVFVLLPEF